MPDLELFLQQLTNGLVVGAGYAIFALGFGLLFSTLKVLNIAAGMYAALPAVAVWYLSDLRHWPFALAIVAGLAAGIAVAVVVDALAFAPLRRRNVGMLGSLITSIGVWFVLGSVADNITQFQVERYPIGSVPRGFLSLGIVTIAPTALVQLVAAVVIAFSLHIFVRRSRTGSAIRAVGYSEVSAALSGVNVNRIVLITTVVSASILAVAGILIAGTSNNVSHALGDSLLFKGFAAMVIGGMGDVRGCLIAGLGIGVAEVMIAQYISTDFRDAITYGLLLLVLVVRPTGIFSERQTTRA